MIFNDAIEHRQFNIGFFCFSRNNAWILTLSLLQMLNSYKWILRPGANFFDFNVFLPPIYGLAIKEHCVAVNLVIFGPGVSFGRDVAWAQFCGGCAKCALQGKTRRIAGGLGSRNRNLLLGAADSDGTFDAHSNCSSVACDHLDCGRGLSGMAWC